MTTKVTHKYIIATPATRRVSKVDWNDDHDVVGVNEHGHTSADDGGLINISTPDLSGYVEKVTGKSLVEDTEIAKIHTLGSDNQDLSNLVVKETGKSLVPDTEISKIHSAGSDNQDLSNLVEKVTGYSLVADSEISKIHAVGSDNQDLSGYVTTSDSRLSDSRTPIAHSHAASDVTGTAVVTNDARLSDARTPLTHSHSASDITGTAVLTNDARLSDARNPLTHTHDYEPANVNIQSHVGSAHAPSNAQKNSDITKAEIEAVLTGEIASHTHAGGATIGYIINVMALTSSPGDGGTTFFGALPKAPAGSSGQSPIYITKAGTIKAAEIFNYSGTAGTGENWSLYIRKNNATDTLIATVGVTTNGRRFSNTNLSIAVAVGDYIEIKSVQPTWATNPLTSIYGGTLYVE